MVKGNWFLDLDIIMKNYMCFATVLLASFSLWNLHFYKCCHFCVYIFLYFTQDIC